MLFFTKGVTLEHKLNGYSSSETSKQFIIFTCSTLLASIIKRHSVAFRVPVKGGDDLAFMNCKSASRWMFIGLSAPVLRVNNFGAHKNLMLNAAISFLLNVAMIIEIL